MATTLCNYGILRNTTRRWRRRAAAVRATREAWRAPGAPGVAGAARCSGQACSCAKACWACQTARCRWAMPPGRQRPHAALALRELGSLGARARDCWWLSRHVQHAATPIDAAAHLMEVAMQYGCMARVVRMSAYL
jgi:hypothetical protein